MAPALLDACALAFLASMSIKSIGIYLVVVAQEEPVSLG